MYYADIVKTKFEWAWHANLITLNVAHSLILTCHRVQRYTPMWDAVIVVVTVQRACTTKKKCNRRFVCCGKQRNTHANGWWCVVSLCYSPWWLHVGIPGICCRHSAKHALVTRKGRVIVNQQQNKKKTCFVPNFLWRLALPLPLAHQGMTCRNIRKTYPPCVRCLYVTFCAWHSHFGLQINSVGGTWKIHRENVTGTDRPNRHHSVLRKGANEN